MTTHQFETHRPVHLFTEIAKGSVAVAATDTTESRVEIAGRDADQVSVLQSGDQITVVAPRHRGGFLGGESRLDVTITVPTGSDVTVKTGSADISVTGSVNGGRLKSGSGNVELDTVTAPATVETGSGDIKVEAAVADLRVKSGSGDVQIGRADATMAASTGSGDVRIGAAEGATVIKTGSGDVEIIRSAHDVSMTTGSGDLVVRAAQRGRLTFKGASSDVRVGVPAGTPVWTDITTVAGDVRSSLVGVGEPAAGADHVEVRARTVSGDIVLTQV